VRNHLGVSLWELVKFTAGFIRDLTLVDWVIVAVIITLCRCMGG
jgi:hypothetical protein